MSRPKKILNDPSRVVTELLDGLTLASNGRLIRLEGKDAIVRSQIRNDKVALLIGGGSGHEPMFRGFIGENLADGAACGQVFAAPAPDLVLAATQAVNRGRGVLRKNTRAVRSSAVRRARSSMFPVWPLSRASLIISPIARRKAGSTR
jgi:dihydroxyacetone kinase-like protein